MMHEFPKHKSPNLSRVQYISYFSYFRKFQGRVALGYIMKVPRALPLAILISPRWGFL